MDPRQPREKQEMSEEEERKRIDNVTRGERSIRSRDIFFMHYGNERMGKETEVQGRDEIEGEDEIEEKGKGRKRERRIMQLIVCIGRDDFRRCVAVLLHRIGVLEYGTDVLLQRQKQDRIAKQITLERRK
ncbi:hypothetical protein LOAG_02635 [Loa loa]|uniref:Uncharacterized protein n=1 Tax=Loa loa TaxID=7209 RepID=A0A1S0U661_LOALO|nr:hypothetical protein LOAG_02635 [Loa loa]EFO25854.1 hypothetical protein LOAG_02635 [Loa loa]